jgi:hypothetical protein
MLKWAKENGCPWNSKTTVFAALKNNFEIFKWAVKNKCPVNSDVCSNIVRNENLEMLKWAKENNCPWNIEVAKIAASNGNLEILKWIHENGCPWNASIAQFSKKNGHLDCFNFIMENQNQIKSETEIFDNDNKDFVDFPISKYCLFCSEQKIDRVFVICGHATCWNCFYKNDEKCFRCL